MMGSKQDCRCRVALTEVARGIAEASGATFFGAGAAREIATTLGLQVAPDWAGRDSVSVDAAHQVAQEYARRQRVAQEVAERARRAARDQAAKVRRVGGPLSVHTASRAPGR